MSKKTENIYAEIERLNKLQKTIESIGKSTDNRELSDVQFEMAQSIKSLKFWIDSLYSYNGKSTSRAKKASSRENGKLGGRPPKEITEARKRIIEIEGTLLPEIEHDLKMTDDLNLEKKLSEEKSKLEEEISQLKIKVEKWESGKKLN